MEGLPIKMSDGTEVENNGRKIIITPVLQKVIAETSNIPLNKINDQYREIYIKILESLIFEK